MRPFLPLGVWTEAIEISIILSCPCIAAAEGLMNDVLLA